MTETATAIRCPECGGTEFEKRGEQRTYHRLDDDLGDDSWTTGDEVREPDELTEDERERPARERIRRTLTTEEG